MRDLKYAILVCGSLVFSLRAVPIQTVDLASTTAWTSKGETDAGWTTIAMPGQRASGSQKWIDYQRSITIPNISPTQTTILRCLSVNDGGMVYINDQQVQQVTYSMFPVNVDLSGFVTPGTTCTLRIRCFSRERYYSAGAFPQALNYGQRLGMPRGIFLDIFPEVYINDVFVRSSVANNNFYYDVWVQNHSASARSIAIKGALSPWNPGDSWNYPALADQTVSVPANTTQKVTVGPVTWGLGTTSYWWPNIPFNENYTAKLHYIHLSINDGSTRLDSLTQRFGFADYTEGPNYFKINGVRVFQMGDGAQEDRWTGPGLGWQLSYVNLEGWGAGPNGAKETWKRYLRLGMNFFRFHNSEATEIMVNAADEVGFITMPESAIRGLSGTEETWDPAFKPAALKAMARYYRSHPSVVRYSLDNEWGGASDANTGKQMIDATVSEDPQRPMSFSQCCGGLSGRINGTNTPYHGWIMAHYGEPASSTSEIRGVEEIFWVNGGRDAQTKYELVQCSQAAILYRMRQYAVFTPWCLPDYWCNFIAGGSLAAGTTSTSYANKDRTDNVDGWGSNIVTFMQNCYHIYCSADIDIIQNRLAMNETSFLNPNNAQSFNNTSTTNRSMVMFNNSLSSHLMRILWETHMDSANGSLVGSGATNAVTLAPGTNNQPSIALPLPGTNSTIRTVYFVVKTEVDGTIQFTEKRYCFRVNNPGVTAAVSSLFAPARKAAPAILYAVTGSRIGEYSGAISGVRGAAGQPARGVAIAVTKTGLNSYGRKVIWMQ
jgi:hypothetical protein